ncbi:hypothetical protein PG991_000443 [Apiospora marii]|uniref:F-box domain-containing protein n=1 Tax=Apiospora marii TaxID=335849 RepID=A0ABR1T3W8_9PEZI
MPREVPTRSKQHASHSNTARNRAQLGRTQKKEFRRRGVFPFFDLPYELRHEILKLAILQETTPTTATNSRSGPSSSTTTTKKSYQQALVLFLTCRWMYEEAAAIFYHEVVLDTRASSDSGSSSSSPTPFLVRSLTPRLYVRTLRIRFYVKEYHLGLFHGVYAPILRDMAQHGRLEHLVLELGYQFPSPSFWGGGSGEESNDADPFHDDVPIIPGRHRKDRELHAPLFVTQAPFQGFLKMLHGFSISSSSSSPSSPATVKKITLYLEAADHPPFWCAFHRAHPSGEACGGSWPDENTQLLKLRWRDLVKTFAGAQAPPTDS